MDNKIYLQNEIDSRMMLMNIAWLKILENANKGDFAYADQVYQRIRNWRKEIEGFKVELSNLVKPEPKPQSNSVVSFYVDGLFVNVKTLDEKRAKEIVNGLKLLPYVEHPSNRGNEVSFHINENYNHRACVERICDIFNIAFNK